MRIHLSFVLCLCLLACGPSQPQKSPDYRLDVVPRGTHTVQPPPPPAPHPLRPAIDPKSNEAAEDLIAGFIRLLNGGRFDDAYMLLGPNAPPRSEFDRRFAGVRHLRVTAGSPGDQEGAAGSIYLSTPLTISGDVNGNHVTRSATAILRRVNDVPGSTEAQRRWHIERIDWSND